MSPRDEQRLKKVVEYCQRIGRTVSRYGNSLDQFQKDEDYQQSICFSILQIGELVNGISDESKAATGKDMPWHQIRGMRNIVAHGYGSIDIFSPFFINDCYCVNTMQILTAFR